MSMSTQLQPSSTRLSNTDTTMALGDNTVPPEFEANPSNHDTPRQLKLKPTSAFGGALFENTKTSTQSNKESNAHATLASSTDTTFAGRQVATSPSHPRLTLSPNNIDLSSKYSNITSALVKANTYPSHLDHAGTSALEVIVNEPRGTHRRINASSNANETASDGKADVGLSSSSRPESNSIQSQTIASGKVKKISKPLTNQGSIQRGALQPQFNTAPASDTTTLLAHKYINAESNTNKIASTGQADVKSSFLSRTGAESVRSQIIRLTSNSIEIRSPVANLQ